MKYYLRELIKENYLKRACGILPDKWYWADVLYLKMYPEDDYSWCYEPFETRKES